MFKFQANFLLKICGYSSMNPFQPWSARNSSLFNQFQLFYWFWWILFNCMNYDFTIFIDLFTHKLMSTAWFWWFTRNFFTRISRIYECQYPLLWSWFQLMVFIIIMHDDTDLHVLKMISYWIIKITLAYYELWSWMKTDFTEVL